MPSEHPPHYKPTHNQNCCPLAAQYLRQGDYLWNNGIFAWKVKTILKEVELYLPKIYEYLNKLPRLNGSFPTKEIREFYDDVEGISIDYGILEQSNNVLVLKADFEWSDLGSFETLSRIAKEGKVDVNQEVIDRYNYFWEGKKASKSPSRRVEKPWGFELIWAQTENYAGKY